MKYIVLLSLLIISTAVHAQTIYRTAEGNYYEMFEQVTVQDLYQEYLALKAKKQAIIDEMTTRYQDKLAERLAPINAKIDELKAKYDKIQANDVLFISGTTTPN